MYVKVSCVKYIQIISNISASHCRRVTSACKHVQTIARMEGCRREYYDFHAIDECLPL